MAFFRNPEIKKTLLLFSVLAAGSAAAAALLISPLAAVAAAALCVIYASIHFTITYLRYKKIAADRRSEGKAPQIFYSADM